MQLIGTRQYKMENVESSLNVISRKKICSEIGVSRDTLKLWIKDRNFPEPLKSSGREPLFKLTEVKEWFSEGE